MTSTLWAILAVSGIGAALAALLVICDRTIANYGECQIAVNDEKTLTVKGGGSLLAALVEQKLFIPSACGGRGTCGVCKVRVLEGAGPVLATEAPFLSPEERKNQIRLSCQVKVRGPMRIRIPEELFSVKEYRATCAEIEDLTHDIKRFRFELVDPAEIAYVPGQYIQLLAPVYPESKEEVYRAYSMSSNPADRSAVETIIRLVPGGICTTWCFKYLKVGDPVRFNGPYGEFRLSSSQAPMVFIAGGSGMAPFVSILHQMKNENIRRKAVYFFGANKVKELFLTDLMRRFEKELADFTFVPVVARPDPDETWDGERGLVTEVVERRMGDLAEYEAYLCGSPGMIDAATAVLENKGLPPDKVFYDKFA